MPWSVTYSMIFFNCNIRWGHYAKTRRASQFLKETPRRGEFAVFCQEIQRIYWKENWSPSYFFNWNWNFEKLKNGKRLWKYRLNCFPLNCSHFQTVWATDARLVPNESYFEVLFGKNSTDRLFLSFECIWLTESQFCKQFFLKQQNRLCLAG